METLLCDEEKTHFGHIWLGFVWQIQQSIRVNFGWTAEITVTWMLKASIYSSLTLRVRKLIIFPFPFSFRSPSLFICCLLFNGISLDIYCMAIWFTFAANSVKCSLNSCFNVTVKGYSSSRQFLAPWRYCYIEPCFNNFFFFTTTFDNFHLHRSLWRTVFA